MYLVIKQYPRQTTDIKNVTITAIALWILLGILSAVDLAVIGIITEILPVVVISIVLAGLLMIVRLMRPVVYRYPYTVVFIPLLIPISYVLVIDVPAMKQIIMMTAQGAGMAVAFMLSISYWKELKNGIIFAVGFLALLAGYLIYWVFMDYMIAGGIWYLFFATGMICIIYSFSGIVQHANQLEVE